ncbi:MAG TPA: PAS domain S-box protein [Stenomitos sp.]
MLNTCEGWESVITRHPVVLPTDAKVLDAIARLRGTPIGLNDSDAGSPSPETSTTASSYVVIVDNRKVVGLFTERDVLHLIGRGDALEQLTLQHFLQSPPITIRESALTDLVTLFNFFQDNQLNHLPILDDADCLSGLISRESLQQAFSLALNEQAKYHQNLQLEILAHQKTKVLLQKSEQRYDLLVAASPIGILQTNQEGICTYANERYCEILGVERSELIGQPWSMGYRLEDIEDIVAAYEQGRRENRPMLIEYRVQRPDGSEVWVYGQAAIEYDAEGQEVGYVGTITDISNRKRAEFLLESQNTLLERIAKAEPLSDILHELVQTVEFHLPGTLCSILLCKAGHLYNAAAPSLPQTYCDAIEGVPIGEGVGSCGTAVFRREVVVVSDIATDPLWQDYKQLALAHHLRACWSAPIVSSDGNVLGVFGIYYQTQRVPQAQDLEKLRQAANIAGIAIEQAQAIQALTQLNQDLERRVAERTAALQASEERWQLALKGSNDGIWDWNPQTNQLFVSQRLKEMHGYGDEELPSSPTDWMQLVHPEDQDRVQNAIADHLSGHTEFFALEYRVQHKNGTYIWVLNRAQAQWDASGQAIRIIGSESDITQRKEAELALQESKQLYATLAEASPIAICRFDAPMNCVYVSEHWSEMTGRPLESALGRGWIEAIHPDDRERILAPWNDPAQPELFPSSLSIQGLEGRHLCPDGSINWFYAQARPEFDAQGQICGCIGTLTDITQLKHIEAELAASEAKYRQLVEGGKDLIWSLDAQDRFSYLSPQFKTLFGWEPSEWIGKPSLDVVYPEDRDWLIAQRALLSIKSGDNYIEFRHCHRDRPYVWVRISSTPVFDATGQRVGHQGILTDITDRKNAELALQDSERRYASLAAAAPVAIFRFDKPLHCVYVNERWSEMTSRPAASALGYGWMEALHPEDREQTLARWSQAYDQETTPESEFSISPSEGRHLRPDGTLNWFYVQMAEEVDEQGNVISYIGTLTDITERKTAELALQDSQAQFQHMTENVPGMIYRYVLNSDGTGKFTYVSSQVREIFELEPETALQDMVQVWARIYPDDLSLLKDNIRIAAETLSPFNCTYRMLLPQKGLRWVQSISYTQRIDNGDVLWDGIIVDISDRKAIEQELIVKQNHLQALLNNIPHIAWIKDEQSRFIAVNQPFGEACGVAAENLIGKTDYDIWPADLAQAYRDDDFEVLQSGQRKVVEEKIALANGKVGWIETTKTPFKDANGNLAGTVGIAADVTDRIHYEQQLRAISERLEVAIQSAQIGIWEYDFANGRLSWDDRMFAIHGIQPEDFGGTNQDWEQCVHPDDLEHAQAGLLDEDNHFRKEFRIVRPDGSIRHVFSSALLQRDAQGQLIRCVGVNLDITERKQAEQQLAELSDRLELATQSAQLGIWEWDAQRDRLTLNDQMFVIYGLNPETFGGTYQDWIERVHPDDLSKAQFAYTPEQTLYTKEFRIVRPNGQIRYILATSLTQRNEQGDLVRIIGSNLDISDRKQAELDLEQEVLRRTTIFNTSSDGIHILDSEANLLEANASFYQMLGYTPEEAKHFNVGDWDAQLTREEVQVNLQNLTQDTTKIIKIETLHRRKDGSNFPVEIYACSMEWNGQMFFISIARDISERKQAEAQLQRTNEELLRATRLKDEFLANMSHELRTPLNAILGTSEGLQEGIYGPLHERQSAALRVIEQSGLHLLDLINEILDLAKIESGYFELEQSSVDVERLCRSSLAFVKQQASRGQIQLRLLLPPIMPRIRADERRLRQVLVNLLNNAVKFTPENGQVILEVTLLPSDDTYHQPRLHFTVADTGIGIAPENLTKLFQPFIQIDSALNRQYEGTGLGLALVKRIVELHGGQVSVTSELGTGSRFVVELPYEPSEQSDVISDPTPAPNLIVFEQDACPIEPLILLAEDNEANIGTLSAYLQAKGYRIQVAKTGQAAIELAQAQAPDAILMDIQMPGMDGLEAIQHIRQIPTLTQVPIIAVTALAMEGDEERCLAAGANLYMSKPLKLKQLVLTLEELLPQVPSGKLTY